MARQSRIVEAVGTSVGSQSGGRSDRAMRIQEAMAAAVTQAIVEGVSLDETDELLRRKQAARDRVLRDQS